MSYRAEDYIKLLIWRPDKGSDRWVRALRSTADYYGWTQKFEPWSPKPQGTSGGYTLCLDPGRKGEMFCEPGLRHRICRSPLRAGMPRGRTNQFKVSESCGLLDLAEIAALTQVDWHWMSGPTGDRKTRAQWLAIHEAGTPYRRGGLVSV